MSMEKNLEKLLHELQSSNVNIQIKIKRKDEAFVKEQKEILKLKKRIEALKEEIFSLIFKVKEKNALVKSIRRQARMAKEKRDDWNKKASSLKEKKESLRKELTFLLEQKYELIDQKRTTRAELDEEKDVVKRKQLYQEIVKIKEQIGEIFEEIRIRRQAYEDARSSLKIARQEARRHHIDMKAYYAYADQIKREADELYQEAKRKREEFRNIRRELRALQYPSPRKRSLKGA